MILVYRNQTQPPAVFRSLDECNIYAHTSMSGTVSFPTAAFIDIGSGGGSRV